ncbi:F0F1 ATP synthase subunit A [Candidatus Gracilibacteria bacterium]|nr:F0F1 ATP synthase subunit A [Candidatus Gracilibacteria bacterium]
MLEEIFSLYMHNSNVIFGIILEIIIILIIALVLKYLKNRKISILIELFYEKVYRFYESILGEGEKKWIKTYVVVLFFVILISNLLGVFLEFFAPMFGVDEEGEFILEHFITNPTLSLNFTLALSISSIAMLLIIQFSKLGTKHFFLEYLPINGKGYLFMEKGKLNKYVYYPMNFFVKTFDIILSVFISLLELVGLLAKVVSLAFRLFGNMISGSILVTIIIVSLSVSTKELTSFIGGFSFPVILPLFIYLQELLIALVQAFIFPMLVSIFIKTTTSHS